MLRFGLPRFSIPALVLLALSVMALARPARAGVSGFRGAPASFSPNGDGRRDLTLLSWTVSGGPADTIVIAVRRSGSSVLNPPLRTFTLPSRPIGRDSLEWDGRDDFATLLPDTLYSMRLIQRDAAGATVAEAVIAIDLDTTAPTVPTIDGPADTAVTDTSYGLGGFASAADTVILFRAGVPFDTLATIGVPPGFGIKVRLIEGDNALSVQSYDRAFNLSPQTTAINVRYVNTPDLSLASALPTVFSPNGDGTLDSTRVTFSLDAPTTRLNVTTRSGEPPDITEDFSLPVATLYEAPAAAGPQSFVWDGRDSVGAIVPDGLYFFRVIAESLSVGGAPIPSHLQRSAILTLDNTPPEAPVLISPLPERTIRNAITIQVRTAIADSLFTRRNGALVSRIATRLFATSNLSIPLVLGDNDLTLTAKDLAGNESPTAGPFRVRYDSPLGFHAPERFGRGDVFVINLTSPARSLVIDLFTLRGRPVRRLFSTQSLTRYEVAWGLDDQVGGAVGDGPYLARLQVTYLDGSIEERKAAVVVVK